MDYEDLFDPHADDDILGSGAGSGDEELFAKLKGNLPKNSLVKLIREKDVPSMMASSVLVATLFSTLDDISVSMPNQMRAIFTSLDELNGNRTSDLHRAFECERQMMILQSTRRTFRLLAKIAEMRLEESGGEDEESIYVSHAALLMDTWLNNRITILRDFYYTFVSEVPDLEPRKDIMEHGRIDPGQASPRRSSDPDAPWDQFLKVLMKMSDKNIRDEFLTLMEEDGTDV